MQWCDSNDLREQCADINGWSDRILNYSEASYIAKASGEAASYLSKYRTFFGAWDSAAPVELSRAVAAIAVYRIVIASAALAPQDMAESPYAAEYKAAVSWLRDLQADRAELYVEWPGIDSTEQQANRATVVIATPRTRF